MNRFWKHSEGRWTAGFLAGGLVLLGIGLWPSSPAPQTPAVPRLQQVLDRGLLRVATVNSPVTYFSVHDRPQGFEYDLAREFAEDLGVELQMVPVKRFGDLFDLVVRGDVDLAAANITGTTRREKLVRFGPAYQEVTQELIYRTGSRRPANPADLVGKRITVVANSSYAETLARLKKQYPRLSWKEQRSGDIESIFADIIAGKTDYTIADSTVLAIHQRFYPQLTRAFSLTDPESIRWAFPAHDSSLLSRAEEFFAQLEGSGRLDHIKDKHHAHLPGYNRVNTHYFLRHVESRLPGLESHFRRAAELTGFDWKLLAAIGYQESHWDEGAVSPTGVRGIMMLTNATAEELGVNDRRDPVESILAGARYLKKMHAKIPARIPEPDRTWMALAAYNVGWGHLEDARVLTQRMGDDPDRWSDVARHLPLLADPEHYPNTRFGYARGREPMQYVHNIRSYHDILTWQVGRESRMAIAP